MTSYKVDREAMFLRKFSEELPLDRSLILLMRPHMARKVSFGTAPENQE